MKLYILNQNRKQDLLGEKSNEKFPCLVSSFQIMSTINISQKLAVCILRLGIRIISQNCKKMSIA